VNETLWWTPFAALALQLWLPLAMALFGRIPGNKSYIAAMLGAALGFAYGLATRDLTFMTAEAVAAVAFTWIRFRVKPQVLGK
jgi:hypothetical protein